MASDERFNSVQDRRRELDAAIDGLYSVFASHRLHGPVDGCPHCTSPADDERLQAKPLRHLTGDDLERFAFKAVTTLGSVEDLKHFLPRLLEIAAHEGPIGYTNFEIVLGKLNYVGWTHWPRAERTAIGQYVIALWHSLLSIFPSPLHADTCLCGIAQVVDDLAPFLNAWRLDTSLPALRHLADFIESNSHTLPNRRLYNGFWKEREPQMQQVFEWLVHADTSSRLEEAFFQYAVEPDATELSQAVDQLGWISKELGSDISPAAGI